MGKKKDTTKAKPKVAEASASEQERVVAAMDALQVSEGWQMIVQNFDANIKYIENLILEKTDQEGNLLEEDQVDNLRNKREIMLDLIKTPQNFISMAKTQGVAAIEDLDPYYNDAKEMASDSVIEMHNAAGGVPPESG